MPNPAPMLFPPSKTTRHTELVKTKDEERLVDLESEDLGLDEGKRSAVDLDKALALLAVCDRGGSLLLAEALDALGGCHGGRVSVRLSSGRGWGVLSCRRRESCG